MWFNYCRIDKRNAAGARFCVNTAWKYADLPKTRAVLTGRRL